MDIRRYASPCSNWFGLNILRKRLEFPGIQISPETSTILILTQDCINATQAIAEVGQRTNISDPAGQQLSGCASAASVKLKNRNT
jgi:hypothetical protein